MFNSDNFIDYTVVVAPNRHNKKHSFLHIATDSINSVVNLLIDFNYKITFIDYETNTVYCKE